MKSKAYKISLVVVIILLIVVGATIMLSKLVLTKTNIEKTDSRADLKKSEIKSKISKPKEMVKESSSDTTQIAGVVLNYCNNLPVSNAVVLADGQVVAKTDDRGTFQFNLLKHYHSFQVKAEGFLPAQFSLPVDPGKFIKIVLHPLVTLQVYLVTENGTYLDEEASVLIRAEGHEGKEAEYTPPGPAVFEKVPVGKLITIRVCRRYAIHGSVARRKIVLKECEPVQKIEIKIARPSAIHGRLVDKDGNTIEKAKLRLVIISQLDVPPDDISWETITLSGGELSGWFSFDGLVPGSYKLFLIDEKTQRRTALWEGNLEYGEGKNLGDIIIPSFHQLKGVVLEPSKKPAPGLNVVIFTKDNAYLSTIPDANGIFSIKVTDSDFPLRLLIIDSCFNKVLFEQFLESLPSSELVIVLNELPTRIEIIGAEEQPYIVKINNKQIEYYPFSEAQNGLFCMYDETGDNVFIKYKDRVFQLDRSKTTINVKKLPPAKTAKVKGIIYIEGGSKAVRASVIFRSETGKFTAICDEQGQFYLYLPEGVYKWYASIDELQASDFQYIVIHSHMQEISVTATIPAALTMRVYIKKAGIPLSTALRVEDINKGKGKIFITNSDGVVEFTASRGLYIITPDEENIPTEGVARLVSLVVDGQQVEFDLSQEMFIYIGQHPSDESVVLVADPINGYISGGIKSTGGFIKVKGFQSNNLLLVLFGSSGEPPKLGRWNIDEGVNWSTATLRILNTGNFVPSVTLLNIDGFSYFIGGINYPVISLGSGTWIVEGLIARATVLIQLPNGKSKIYTLTQQQIQTITFD